MPKEAITGMKKKHESITFKDAAHTVFQIQIFSHIFFYARTKCKRCNNAPYIAGYTWATTDHTRCVPWNNDKILINMDLFSYQHGFVFLTTWICFLTKHGFVCLSTINMDLFTYQHWCVSLSTRIYFPINMDVFTYQHGFVSLLTWILNIDLGSQVDPS